MYIDKHTIYSDAGKYLISGNQIGFQFPDTYTVTEYDINLNDLYISGNTAYYNNSTLAQNIIPKYNYSDYKREIIKKRYSNDDQIAIILNKEDSQEDLNRYNKMMEWRNFASLLATEIIKRNNAI